MPDPVEGDGFSNTKDREEVSRLFAPFAVLLVFARSVLAVLIVGALYHVAKSPFEAAVVSTLIILYLAIRGGEFKAPGKEVPKSLAIAVLLNLGVDMIIGVVATVVIIALWFSE